jgi:hypothetical protein
MTSNSPSPNANQKIDRRPITHNNRDMSETDLQDLCEQGQEFLMQTRYWDAERVLAQAESIAWEARDWDTLARLYMPLQEARRQRRQRCGEGMVALNLLSQTVNDPLDPQKIVADFPQGQLLVAGWGSIDSAIGVRRIAAENSLYLETFLAAVYPVNAGKLIVIVPTAEVRLPPADQHWPIDQLIPKLPVHSIVLAESELPQTPQPGTTQTYAKTMALWERLAAPFLAAADQCVDPTAKVEGYRRTIKVDYACELAHQKLSDLAKSMDAQQKQNRKV